MNYKSVTGKNWLFNKYDKNYAKKYLNLSILTIFYRKLFQ